MTCDKPHETCDKRLFFPSKRQSNSKKQKEKKMTYQSMTETHATATATAATDKIGMTGTKGALVAVRLYENRKFGGTFAPNKYYTAMFNATADVVAPHIKYLLDYVPYSQWANSLRTPVQHEAFDIDPPPLNWSTLKYVLFQRGGSYPCLENVISLKR